MGGLLIPELTCRRRSMGGGHRWGEMALEVGGGGGGGGTARRGSGGRAGGELHFLCFSSLSLLLALLSVWLLGLLLRYILSMAFRASVR